MKYFAENILPYIIGAIIGLSLPIKVTWTLLALIPFVFGIIAWRVNGRAESGQVSAIMFGLALLGWTVWVTASILFLLWR